jgi:hypothetical protein
MRDRKLEELVLYTGWEDRQVERGTSPLLGTEERQVEKETGLIPDTGRETGR